MANDEFVDEDRLSFLDGGGEWSLDVFIKQYNDII